MTEGKDEFLQKVTDKGLTYFPYDMEFGTPMWYRTGRHLTGALEVIFWASFFYPEMDCQVTWPTYLEMAELEEQGIDSVGYYLKDPDAPENKDRAFTIYYKPVGANYDKYTK